MDTLDLVIIAIATLTAIAFKWFLFRRIRGWMDQDLIKGLAAGDSAKLQYLQQEYQRLSAEKLPRNQLHDTLTELAKRYSV